MRSKRCRAENSERCRPGRRQGTSLACPAAPTTRLPRHAPHVLAQAPALPPRRPTIICAVTAEPRALHLASTRQLLWMRRREERLELSGERTVTWCLAQPRRSLAHPHLPPHAPEPGRRPLPQQARSQQRRWRRSLWMQLHVPRRVRRTVSRRCGQSRGSPSEAAVVVNGVDLRAASVAASPELQRADAQTRLAPQHVDAVALASARSTNREPGMRIKPRIALRGGRGGQRRRFPCGLRCAPSECWSEPTRGRGWRRWCGCSTLPGGAFDAPRDIDADGAADRPQRRPW